MCALLAPQLLGVTEKRRTPSGARQVTHMPHALAAASLSDGQSDGQSGETDTARIAVCITGSIDSNFSLTATNLETALLRPLRQVGDTDLFFHVKNKTALDTAAMATLDSLEPQVLSMYSHDEPLPSETTCSTAGDPNDSDPGNYRLRSAWLQHYQWLGCWQLVEAKEREAGVRYDFLVRTRPDLLYDERMFRPEEWSLWANGGEGDQAETMCKCSATFVHEQTSFMHGAPIFDIFIAAPRRVAQVLMTTWSRQNALAETELRAWSTRDTCGFRLDADLPECLLLFDLNRTLPGTNVVVAPSMLKASLTALAVGNETRVRFGTCEAIASVGADGISNIVGAVVYHTIFDQGYAVQGSCGDS